MHSLSKMIVLRIPTVRYRGRKYETATGLTKSLALSAAYGLMERYGRDNPHKYGVPYYSNRKGAALWKLNLKRLRNKFYRRALPIVEKVFDGN